MKILAPSMLVIVVIASLVAGGIVGFGLGLASTKAGKAFLEGIFEEEKNAEVSHPKKMVREKFELQYPSNWKIDVDDKDYDPDYMFSIESPGNAFVMFVLGGGDTEPEDNLQIQISQFKKLVSNPAIERFERYGRLTGKGARLKGKFMGIRTTVKLFSYHKDGLMIMITEQCPDEDVKRVQDGLSLIENHFMLRTNDKKGTPAP